MKSLAFAALLTLAWPTPAQAAFSGPDACAPCHAEEHAEWKGSVHSRAFKGKFKAAWEADGAKARCLECHTTGHVPGSAKHAFPGVTCESCHGAMSSGHPGDAKMPIPVSPAMCQGCHKQTYKEWKLSKHGAKNIRCFDCHKVHGQGLRAGGKEGLCGACHPGRLKDFAHATHHVEGLTCMTCHMPVSARAGNIEGTGAAGHTLSVGTEVCVRCHEGTVHQSSKLPVLRGEVSDYRKQLTIAGVRDVFELKEQADDLKWRLDRSRQSLWLVATLGLVAGLALGWLSSWYLWRRRSA